MQYLWWYPMLRTLVRSLSLVAILAGTVVVSAPAEADTHTAVHKQARKAKKSARKTQKHPKRKAKLAKKRANAAPAH